MGAPPPIQLASLGMADSLILMVLALVVFGPRRLPQIGRQIGKLMYEFRKASNDFKFQMEEELRISEEADRRKKEEAERAARAAALPAPTQTVEAAATIAPPEQESVSAQPATATPAQYLPATSATAAESATAAQSETAQPESHVPESHVPESHVTTPRTVPVIQPPSTGEQVQAAKPNAAAPSVLEPQPTANGTEPPASPQDPTASETVTQHG